MTDTGFVPLTGGARWMGRQMRKGVRGNITKRIAELIKNSDDAYDRLELKGQKTSGIIEIACDTLKNTSGKGSSVKGFLVRDFGSGMSYDKVKSAYFGGVHGNDTSEETRNGAIGVGGKDAFVDMENCTVLTVHEGVLTVVELISDKVGQISTKILTDDNTVAALAFANKLLKKGKLEEICLSKNQTLAMFRLPDSTSGPRIDKLIENLRTFSTLRWIMESDIRSIKFTNLMNATTVKLSHKPLTGHLLDADTFEIAFNQIPYEVKVEFRKSDEDLSHNANNGYGILIQSGRGAILDNQMYGFESDSAASKIFGKVIFNDWKKLYRESGGQILTDNREGLEYQHEVNSILKTRILTKLKKIVDDERQKQGNNPKLDRTLDTNIKKAMSLLNKLIDKKPTLDVPEPPRSTPDGLEFESSSYSFAPKKPQIIKLYLNPSKIPQNSDIVLLLNGVGITINPDSIIQTPEQYDSEPFVEIEVTGKELTTKSTRTTLKAIYGDLEAETEIYICFEHDFQPKNGFSFRPVKINLIPNKSRKIKLVIDTNLISVGTPIFLTSNDDRLKFSPETLTVSGPPNFGKYLTEETISISSDKLGLNAKLLAETETKASSNMGQGVKEIRTSTCDIIVKEKEPPKTFFKGYEIDRKGNKRVRSRFKDGMVYIHVNAPIQRETFGQNQEYLIREKTETALSMLADTVVYRMTYELAKHQVETGIVDVVDDELTAIEITQNELEYEYGLGLYQTIIYGSIRSQNT